MSDKQLKILKNIKKHKRYAIVMKKCGYTLDQYFELQENFPDGSLQYMDFSDDNFDENSEIVLTPYGESIYDEYRRIRFRFFIPVAISICAVLISLIALVKSFV